MTTRFRVIGVSVSFFVPDALFRGIPEHCLGDNYRPVPASCLTQNRSAELPQVRYGEGGVSRR